MENVSGEQPFAKSMPRCSRQPDDDRKEYTPVADIFTARDVCGKREKERETHLRNIVAAFPPPCLPGMEIICAAVSSRGGSPEASPPSRQDVVGEIVLTFFSFAFSFFSEALKVLK